MEKDSKYQAYATTLVKEVPGEDIKYLIALFMKEAAINMGSDTDTRTLERTTYHIQKEFSFIPISYIGSAFVRGSLGQFGVGRLVPRTIYGWLNEMSLEYNRMMSKEKYKDHNTQIAIAYNLHKYPIGSAIAKKIDWYNKGLLKIENWDKIPIKELAEREAKHLESYPQIFGIENR